MKSSLYLLNQLPFQLPAEIPSIELSYKNPASYHDLPKISVSKDSYDILLPCFDQQTIELREEFKILLLKRDHTVLGKVDLFVGGTKGVLVDPKFILVAACLSNATGVILSHNHPSGQLKPSEADMNITMKVKAALNLVDISLVDHIIVTNHGYFSFADDHRL